jgi:hypothetical protein
MYTEKQQKQIANKLRKMERRMQYIRLQHEMTTEDWSRYYALSPEAREKHERKLKYWLSGHPKARFPSIEVDELARAQGE